MSNPPPKANRIQCYRERWPDTEVPTDEPTWLYYEVDILEDNILRTAFIFADGRVERNSVELEERNGDTCPSLTDQPFLEMIRDVPLEPIPAALFESFWAQGTDTPFWFPDGFPKHYR